MRRIADKLFGDDYQWSILAAGRHQLPFVSIGAIMGGNVRVGLEDSLYAGAGKLATSNAEQVTHRAQHPGGPVAGCRHAREARQMLALKGGDRVAF